MISKKYKRILTYCALLIITSLITYTIDSQLVFQDKRPIFVFPTAVVKDGGTTIYRGLGYKVIGWKVLEVRLVDGKEVVGRMTGYEISSLFKSQNINKGPQKELKFIIKDEN